MAPKKPAKTPIAKDAVKRPIIPPSDKKPKKAPVPLGQVKVVATPSQQEAREAAQVAKMKPRATANPTARYESNVWGTFGYGVAYLDGAPFYTWFDIPRMQRDPRVMFLERMWQSPFQQVTWKVKATNQTVAEYVDRQFTRFWTRSLHALLYRYFWYGFAPGGAEFEHRNGIITLEQVRPVEPYDARPLVYKGGPNDKQLAGMQFGNTQVLAPHAFWFAGEKRFGKFYDRPPAAGMFEPWAEKRMRNGAVAMRRTWFLANSSRGKVGRYPEGETSTTGGETTPRDNKDLMNEMLDNAMANANFALPSTLNPGAPDKYLWDVEWQDSFPDRAGYRDYPKDLDEEMAEGVGIPKEVLEAAQTGSGFSGRAIPMMAWLGSADVMVGLLVASCDWLKYAVQINYGPQAAFEIMPDSLVTKFQEDQKNNRPQQPPWGQPPWGQPPWGQPPGGTGGGSQGQPDDYTGPRGGRGGHGHRLPGGGVKYLGDGRADGYGNPRYMDMDGKPFGQHWTPIPGEIGRRVKDGLRNARQLSDGRTEPGPTDPARRRKQLMVMLAMLEFQRRAHAVNDPASSAPYLAALSKYLQNPDGLHYPLQLSWRADESKSGHVKAIGEAEHAGRVLYGARAEAALRAQEGLRSAGQNTKIPTPHPNHDQWRKAGVRAREILTKFAADTHTPEELTELSQHLPYLPMDRLGTARSILRAQFKGVRGRLSQVNALMDHIREQVGVMGQKAAEEPMLKHLAGDAETPNGGSPLDHLAAMHHDPEAMLRSSQDLTTHDAINAAYRGEFGDDVKGAVERGGHWNNHGGNLVKKHAAIGKELATLKGKQQEKASQALTETKQPQLPIIPDGMNRATHFTSAASAAAIMRNGLDYSKHGILENTADLHGEDNQSVLDTIRTHKVGAFDRSKFGNHAVIMDIPERESRDHHDFTRATGRVDSSRVVGVVNRDTGEFTRNPNYNPHKAVAQRDEPTAGPIRRRPGADGPLVPVPAPDSSAALKGQKETPQESTESAPITPVESNKVAKPVGEANKHTGNPTEPWEADVKAALRRGNKEEPPAEQPKSPVDSVAAAVNEEAANAPSGWSGDDLLLINHAYKHLKEKRPELKDMTLDDFKKHLLDAMRERKVNLSRADIPQALNANDVKDSEVQFLNGQWHFIKTPKGKSEEQPKSLENADRLHPSPLPPGDRDLVAGLKDQHPPESRKDLPVQDVPVDSLRGTQDHIDPDKVKSMQGKDDLPPMDVVKDGEGQHHVEDGHHRGAAAIANGDETVPARVWEKGEEGFKPAEVPDKTKDMGQPSKASLPEGVVPVFHHSTEEIGEFKPGGTYLTTSEHGYARRGTATHNNPRLIDTRGLKLANKKQATEAGRFRGDKQAYMENLRKMGFDGAKYTEDGDTTFFIMDPKHILPVDHFNEQEKGEGGFKPAEPASDEEGSSDVGVSSGPAPEVNDTTRELERHRIEDFGEKIGGARKDDAVKTGPRGSAMSKPKDERPGWARRYHIGQDAKTGRWFIADQKKKGYGSLIKGDYATKEEAEAVVPLLEVARNHRVYEEPRERTAAENAHNAESSRLADEWLAGVAKDVDALKTEHSGLITKVHLTDQFKRAVAALRMTTEQYETAKENGTILSDDEYAKGKEVLNRIEEIKNRPMPTPAAPEPKRTYAIHRVIGDRKRPVVKGGFASRDEAMRYMAKNPEEIINHEFNFPAEVPHLDHIQRTGSERRKGDIAPKDFQNQFGFRGGEFGNWNKGEHGQAALNHAYDALHDLAEVIGADPKAVSLNGNLAIAFGARGHGGKDAARAHYERSKAVINLTKIKGAGTLAHEWFHALDHHIGKLMGKTGGDREGAYASHGAPWNSPARKEVLDAFKNVMNTIHAKTVDEPLEAGRENKRVSYMKDAISSDLGDIAARLRGNQQYNKRFKAFTPDQQKEWDGLLDDLKAGNYGNKVFVEGKDKFGGYESYESVQKLNALFKAATGRSFITAEPDSSGRRIVAHIQSALDAAKRVGQAQEGATESRKRSTDYLHQAKKIDSHRLSDYWSSPHELAARAFESFVNDKIKEKGNRSDYLTYGSKNTALNSALGKPYPEGEERTAINAAFQRLLDAIEESELQGKRREAK